MQSARYGEEILARLDVQGIRALDGQGDILNNVENHWI
jgi:hypothetical protein